MRVTLHDIAHICQVDVSTVSRVLRDDPRISAATKATVRATAAKLGYRPNLAARLLVQGHSHIIWFVVPALGTVIDWCTAEAASLYATKRGYDTAIAVHHGRQADFDRLVQSMNSGLAAGAVINRRDIADISAVHRLVQQQFPLVFVDVPVDSLPTTCVTTDNRAASAELAGRCATAGARTFVSLFDPARNAVEQLRQDGALTALAQLGLRHIGAHDEAALRRAITQSAPLAILASAQSLIHAYVVTHAALLARAPLVAACFDVWQGEPHPAQTVFVGVQDYKQMADVALDRLWELLDSPSAHPQRGTVQLPLAEIKTISRQFA